MLHIILLQSKLSSRLSSHYRILTKSRFLTTNISTKSIANELKVPIDLIRTFPELAKVSELRRLGKLKQALEAVTFTYDILVNATGFTSIQSKSLRRLQIALQFEAFDKKSSSYSNIHDIKIAFTDVDEFQVDGLMLLSAHRLVSNDLKGAIEAATAAVEACEDTNISPSIPVQCFSPAYGLKGKHVESVD